MKLLLGDCRAVLRDLEAGSVDACVCDPPYELNFMNASWDRRGVAFDPRTWEAVLRVLKPGAHLIAAGGSRTFHRLACAIEDAGAEIRDCIGHAHAQGFPKSLDVGKAIDKAAGVEREVVGRKADPRYSSPAGESSGVPMGNLDTRSNGAELYARAGLLTAPATPEAAAWDGWGTALKPALEFWTVARKPLSEPTVAANVLRWGVGGLNVEAGRIGGQAKPKKQVGLRQSGTGFSNRTTFDAGPDYEPSPAGRWPANFVLSHVGPDEDGNGGCELRGERRVQTHWSGTKGAIRASVGYEGPSLGKDSRENGHPLTAYNDPDGMEQVADWHCAPGCPVAELDRQSGVSRQAGYRRNPSFANAEDSVTGWNHGLRGERGYQDVGAASRFFFTSKASTAERLLLCHLCDGVYPAKERAAHRHDREDWAHLTQHPTQKPLALLRWLVRLVTPPGGTCLDPFLGTGTTGEACALEGMEFVGIEQSADYLRIAEHRLSRHRQTTLSLEVTR